MAGEDDEHDEQPKDELTADPPKRMIPAVSANRQKTPTTASRPTKIRIASGGM